MTTENTANVDQTTLASKLGKTTLTSAATTVGVMGAFIALGWAKRKLDDRKARVAAAEFPLNDE